MAAGRRLERRLALQYKLPPQGRDHRLTAGRRPSRSAAREIEAMDKICIRGGVPLEGVIPIGGAKNAALPLMAASLLTAETLTLKNVPALADIATMANLLVQHGVAITRGGEGSDLGHV